MDENRVTASIVEQLGERRAEFVAETRRAIQSHIEAQGSGCLTIVGRREPGGPVDRTWTLSASPEYVRCLSAFCRGQKHLGFTLDSGLTEPIIGIVTARFEAFYGESNEEIAAALVDAIARDQVLAESLTRTMVSSAGGVTRHASQAVQHKVAALLSDQMQSVIHTNAGQAVMATTSDVVASAVATPLVHSIATMLVKLLAVHLKTIIAHILASAAIKTMIAAAVKKFVLGALMASLVKAVAAKLGIAAGGAFMIVLLPLVAAFIAYEVITFPKQLGEKVAGKVAAELGEHFDEINTNIVLQIIGDFGRTGITTLARQVAQDPTVQHNLAALVADMS